MACKRTTGFTVNTNNVLVKLIFVFSVVPPMSTIHNCPSNVTEGNNVTLYCNATGNPPPEVAWIRSGKVLVKDSAYIMSAIKRNQTGIYECMAWNGIGNNFTANCSLHVLCKYSNGGKTPAFATFDPT